MQEIRNITKHKYTAQNLYSLAKILSNYISKSDKIVVGVSGGPDSMFLGYTIYKFFQSKKYNIDDLIFVHLNHGIRKESVEEMKNIKKRFKGAQLETFVRSDSLKHTENELRKRRYQKFLKVMIKYGSKKIFLGHHFDDRVETSLLNLLRGCGLDGFMSIKPIEYHHLLAGKSVFRPLLNIRKKQILSRCESLNIPYFQDKTNQDSNISQRNFLRNEILPELFMQEGFEQLFKNRYKRYDSQSIENLLQPISISPNRQAKSAYCLLKKREDLISQDLLRILKQLHASSGVTSKTLKEFLSFVKTGSKGWKQIQGVVVMISHDKVYFFVAKPLFREKPLDKSHQIDTYYYKGKTWNKYCITQKIPIFWRNFVPVVAKGNKIISWDKKRRKENVVY